MPKASAEGITISGKKTDGASQTGILNCRRSYLYLYDRYNFGAATN
ncbi:MAG: hypothetical protein O3A15_01370 [Proteobacteria bacterium]|nr:hypothetical protein [Pseudomonadota bacterium]